MSRLDRLILELKGAGGEALIFTTGRALQSLVQGKMIPSPNQPATTSDIVGLFLEIVPPDQAFELEGDCELRFPYQVQGGPCTQATVDRKGDVVFAQVRLVADAPAPAPAPAASAPALVSSEPGWDFFGDEAPPLTAGADLGSARDLELPEGLPPLELDLPGDAPEPPAAPASPDLESDPGPAPAKTAARTLEDGVASAGAPAAPKAAAAAASPAPAPAPTAPGAARIQSSGRGLRSLLGLLRAQGGSDIHIAAECAPRMRVRGELVEIDQPPLSSAEIEALFQSTLNREQRQVFDKERSVDFSLELAGLGRFRGNAYRERKGVDLVLRAVPVQIPNLSSLGLPPSVEKLTQYPNGLILVTGPAGCGKSTTQAAIVDRINETWHDHIITIEDPIEFIHPQKNCLVNQREVGTHVRDFAEALRSALREDPDVILIGELRDLETIQLAITAAETGHLVIGTLHTVDAARTVNRLVDVFPSGQKAQIRSMVSESLRGIISQRLINSADGKGRVAAFEVLITDRSISNLIREGKVYQIPNLLKVGKAKGMISMDDAIIDLVKQGKADPTAAQEAMEKPDELEKALKKPAPAAAPSKPGAKPAPETPAAASVRLPRGIGGGGSR